MAGMGIKDIEQAFWAGSATSGSAPFHVGHDGTLVTEKAYINKQINFKPDAGREKVKIYCHGEEGLSEK